MEPESIKVVLLGEAGVGKTCIIKQFTENKFDINVISSLSAQFVSKTIEYTDFGKALKFDIWDTVGQERFRSIAKIFYKDAQVIILVYDITSQKTFDALTNFWYDEIKNNSSGNPVFAVVGNKNDLYQKQQVDPLDAKDFAKKLGGIFQLTSAMTSEGIGLLFDNIGKKILKPSYQYDEKDKIAKDNYNKKKEEEKNTKIRIKLNNNSNISNTPRITPFPCPKNILSPIPKIILLNNKNKLKHSESSNRIINKKQKINSNQNTVTINSKYLNKQKESVNGFNLNINREKEKKKNNKTKIPNSNYIKSLNSLESNIININIDDLKNKNRFLAKNVVDGNFVENMKMKHSITNTESENLEISVQSLNDSKIMELAKNYIKQEDNLNHNEINQILNSKKSLV